MSNKGILSISMRPQTRRVVYAILYELIAILTVTPVVAIINNRPIISSFGFSASMSCIALAWNYIFNSLFERWERKQSDKTRTPLRRVMHGLGFEGGLVVILVPVVAWWMKISLFAAFLVDLGFFAFFFVYTIAFTWAFDKVFGLPSSTS